MKRTAAIALSLLIICFSIISVSAIDYKCNVDTVSGAVYLENLNTGSVIYEKDSSKQMYPASTTKIMTYIITAENVSDLSNTTVTVNQDVIDGLDPESTVMGLAYHVGEQVSVKDLLYGLMLPSGNDAALVLADYVGGGSISAFVDKMNAKAAELGCANTHFANPHGLYDTNHYSTAHDMALIAKYAMKLDGFMDICNTVSYTPDGYSTLHNTNYMIDPDAEGGVYYYQYTKGIKTGYLDEAGKCLVTSADKDGTTYLCVCLGADYTFEENVNYAMKDTAKLYEWAYENLGIQTLYSPSDSVASVDVKYVRDGKTLSAVPQKEISAFLPKDYDKSLLKVDINCPEQVEAPVTKGDVLGTVSVKYDDLDLGVTDLLAAEDVERDISPFEVFIKEHVALIIIILLVLLVLIFILISMRSASRRRKARARERARSREGSREYPRTRESERTREPSRSRNDSGRRYR